MLSLLVCIRFWEPFCAVYVGRKRGLGWKCPLTLHFICIFCQKKLFKSVKSLILKPTSNLTKLNSTHCSTGKTLPQVSWGEVVKGQLESPEGGEWRWKALRPDKLCSVTSLSLSFQCSFKLQELTSGFEGLVQLQAYNTTLIYFFLKGRESKVEKRNCARCLTTKSAGNSELFESQLARKCAKDYMLCWIIGQRITPKQSEWPCCPNTERQLQILRTCYRSFN